MAAHRGFHWSAATGRTSSFWRAPLWRRATSPLRPLSILTVLAVALVWSNEPAQSADAPKVSPGKGTLIVGTFPDKFWVIDEASGKITGTIPYSAGIPRRTTLSADRKRFYTVEAQMEKVEVIDIATRKTLDVFTLSEGSTKVRIRSVAADPRNRFLLMVTRAATRTIDRFEIGPSTLVQYDLAARKVAHTLRWPNDEERENANIQFSPDGTLMYLFSDQDILIYETAGFTQVDKWEMSKPLEDGFGRLDFGSTDAMNDEPGFYTGVFTVQDPVQNRRLMGVGRVNLAAKSVDFYTLGPATPLNFALAPGRQRAFGVFQDIGRFEFWTFDLQKRRIANRAEFKGRPRMSLKTSSNGQVLYIYNAGNTIDLYDAATYRYLSTINLDGDMTTELFVFPPTS